MKIGDQFPEATLTESTEFGEACPIRPTTLSTSELIRGRRIVMFTLPGAYTPTCSAKHVPGYLEALPALRAKGVDEVWCVSVNDGYVMAEWGKQQGAIGKVRMLGDGEGQLAKKLGLDVAIPNMGTRMRRCSLLVDDGVVKQINVEEPGKFEVSNAEKMLEQLG